MALFWRIWAAVSVVNLAVLAIFVGLATLQFDQIHSALVGERLVVLADRTAAPFLAAARINLPLSSVRNAAALLERARQIDDVIAAIHVFDADGAILHSTEAQPPAAIPPIAMAARAQAAALPWYRETDEGFLSSIDIPGSAGGTTGGILVVYPSWGNAINVRAMGAELALAAISLLVLVSALSGLLLRLTLGRQIAAFEAIEEAIAGFERDSWRSGAARKKPAEIAEDAGELRVLLEAADRHYRVVGQSVAAADQDVGR
jgi:hypothetical protein